MLQSQNNSTIRNKQCLYFALVKCWTEGTQTEWVEVANSAQVSTPEPFVFCFPGMSFKLRLKKLNETY